MAPAVIPIRDENPTRNFAWVTLVILLANVAVFAFEASRPVAEFDRLVMTWAFVPARFFGAPFSAFEWTTVFTSMFMHGGWLHLGSNMLYLWIFGNNIEDRLGPWRFLFFYLSCGVVATGLQALTDVGSTMPLIGASGAIAGVLGAYLVLYPRAKVLTVIPILFLIELAALPAVFVIGFWFLTQLVQGVAALSPMAAQGGVAWFAHIGGFLAGLIAAAPFAIADAVKRRKRHHRATWR